MTPDELMGCLAELGLSQAATARRLSSETGLHYDRRDVHRWTSGHRPTPKTVAALIRAWSRSHQVLHRPAWCCLAPASLPEARQLLKKWGHARGGINRPFRTEAHVIEAHGHPVAVTITTELLRPPVGGDLYRPDAIELARLCTADASWSRVALRLWRNVVFPTYKRKWAVSYQDVTIHDRKTYRFDGWRKIGRTKADYDQRTGRKEEAKVLWGFCEDTRDLKTKELKET